MREIKFRAWLTLSDYDDEGSDADYCGMATRLSIHHDGGIGFHVDEGNRVFGGEIFERARENGTAYDYEDWCYWEGQFELMQYTGLKDKNGVEIYEGDIVKNPDGIAPVIYLSDGFVLSGLYKGETMDTQPLLWHPMSELEVIGNIYENPELLK